MIVSAKEMRNETRMNDEMQAAINRVMRDIKKASGRGETHCLFNPGGYWLEEPVKREFEKAGYTFRPVGYVGGVWQLCEYIMW